MSVWIPTQKDQMSAVDEYNAYCNAHQDIESQYQLDVFAIIEGYGEDEEEMRRRINELQVSEKYFRHYSEMCRLIGRLNQEDSRATQSAIGRGEAFEIDPYWSTVVDEAHKLNPHHEKTTRQVYDMSKREHHPVTRKRSSVSSGTK